MSYAVSEVGGLAVAFNPSTEDAVARALRRLDPSLFLDPELEPYGPRGAYVYMTVKQHVGSGYPPIPVLEWRDSRGPWPLSMALVEKVRRREWAMVGAVEAVVRANKDRMEKASRDVGDAAFDIAMSDGPKATGKRSALLPRSQSLRQSRDRARAKGRNV